MNKQRAVLLTAFVLLAATAVALNGGVLSIATAAYSGGGAGALQCVYATSADATHPTTWKRRILPNGTWSTAKAVGSALVPISTGGANVDYEVKFFPTSPDTFTGTNPVSVRISPNKLTTVTVRYQ